MYHVFIFSSLGGCLGCSHVLAIVNSAAVNIRVVYLLKLWLSPDRCPEVGLQGHISSIFSFLRGIHTVLHSGCINLHFHQQCRKFPFSPYLSSIYCLYIYIFFFFSDGGHSDWCEWNLIVVLVCIVRKSYLQHLFHRDYRKKKVNKYRISFLNADSEYHCNVIKWKWKWSRSVVSDSLRPHGL